MLLSDPSQIFLMLLEIHDRLTCLGELASMNGSISRAVDGSLIDPTVGALILRTTHLRDTFLTLIKEHLLHCAVAEMADFEALEQEARVILKLAIVSLGRDPEGDLQEAGYSLITPVCS